VRIATITSSFPRFQGDGVGSFIYSLMVSLAHLGHFVIVLAPDDPTVVPGWQTDIPVKRIRFIWPRSWSRLGHAQSLAADMRLRWHALPLVVLFSLFSIWRLWRVIRWQRADIIYAHWLVPGGVIGAVVSWLSGIPLVISAHGSDVFVVQRYALLRPVVHFAFRVACHVIACSSDLAHRITTLGMCQDRVSVVPYGVDIERYEFWRSDGAASVEPTIVQGRSTVMVMGRLVAKKGFTYLLQAVPLVLAQYPDTTFLIAGEGDLRADLEGLVADLGIQEQVCFLGHIPWDQTPRYLADVDVFVVPSVVDQAGNVDGLPNVLLEAMASGCAIVASRVAGIPDVIRDGENGMLVPPRDVQALAEAICILLRDPTLRYRMGRSAQATVRDRLGWAHIGELVALILQNCVQRGRC